MSWQPEGSQPPGWQPEGWEPGTGTKPGGVVATLQYPSATFVLPGEELQA